MHHTLTVLSAELVRNAPDDKPEATSSGTSGNTWGVVTKGGGSVNNKLDEGKKKHDFKKQLML